MKISFKKVDPSAEVSLIAQVTGNTFKKYTHAKNGYTFSAFNMGKVDKEAMFQQAEEANTMMCWILRVLSLILIIAGISTVLKPLSVLASVVPILGKIVGVGTGLIAKVIGAAWWLLIVALAWLFYRPLIAIPLLIAFGAAVGFAVKKLMAAKAPAAPAAPAAPDTIAPPPES